MAATADPQPETPFVESHNETEAQRKEDVRAKHDEAKLAHKRGDLHEADILLAQCLEEMALLKYEDAPIIDVIKDMAGVHEDIAIAQFAYLCENPGEYTENQKLCLRLQSIIQSATLIYGVINRVHELDTEPLWSNLDRLHHLLLELIHGNENASVGCKSCLCISQEYQQRLAQNRERYMKLVSEIDMSVFENVPDDIGERMAKERKFVDSVESLMTEITKDLKSLYRHIYEYAKAAVGPEPCRNCLLAFGSVGRGECTPYSDLEFGFTLSEDLEENRQYFRMITLYMNFIVVLFGETMITTVGIESIRQYAPHFFDKAPRGISLDANTPFAAKVPVGWINMDKGPLRTELMGTPGGLAALQLETNDRLIAYHVAEVCRSFSYVAGNLDLAEEYRSEILKIMETSTHIQKQALKTLTDEVPKKDCGLMGAGGTYWDVKNHIYRVPSLFTCNLGALYKMPDLSPWQSVWKLVEMEKLNEKAAHNILTMLSCAHLLRTATYLGQRRRTEEIHCGTPLLSGDVGAATKCLNIPTDAIILRVFKTITSLYKAFEKHINDKTLEELQAHFIPDSENLYITGTENIGALLRRLGRYHELNDLYERKLSVLLQQQPATDKITKRIAYMNSALGQVCRNNGDVHGGKVKFEKAMAALEALGPDKWDLKIFMQASSGIAWAKSTQGHLYEAITDLKRLRNKIPESEDVKIVQVEHNIGKLYIQKGDHHTAQQHFQEADKRLKALSSEKSMPALSSAVASSLAQVAGNLGDFDAAINGYQDCLEIQYKLYGKSMASNSIVRTLNNLGWYRRQKGEYAEAKELLQNAEKMLNKLGPEKGAPRLFAKVASNLAGIEGDCGNYDDAIQGYKKVLEMQYCLYGRNAQHSEIAKSYRYLGNMYLKKDDVSTAMAWLNQSKDMLDELGPDNRDNTLYTSLCEDLSFQEGPL